jgi:hypothetical protein
MGMYTDYALKFSIKKESEDFDLIMSVMEHMMGSRKVLTRTPDHPLFKTVRWDIMANSGRSFKKKDEHFGNVDFMLIGEFKNYEAEIDKFIDWITPYLYDNLTGYSHYEGASFSTAYFVDAFNY